MNPTLRAILVSLTVSTLILGETINDFTSVSNRFFWRWDALDKWVILTLFATISVAGVVGFTLFRLSKSERVRWVGWHLFLLVLLEGLLINIPSMRHWSLPMQLVEWALVLAAIGISFATPRWKIPQRAALLALVFSAFPIIVILQMFSWAPQTKADTARPTQMARSASATSQPTSRPASPFVLVLSFDALGWPPLSTPEGEIRPEFVNLRELSQQSWVFRNGSSPDRATRFSLPRMVFQTDAVFVTPGRKTKAFGRSNEPGFNVDGTFTATDKLETIFTPAQALGYETRMSTFYMPWSKLLGGKIDTITEYPIDPKGDDYPSRLKQLAWITAGYLNYPGCGPVAELIERTQFSQNWHDINLKQQAEALAFVRSAPQRAQGFFHFPLPHPPFVFKADGEYAGPYRPGRTKEGTDEEYHNQLLVINRFVGQVVAELKASGKYDDSLLIITADHGWFSPEARKPLKTDNDHHPDRMKVPIILKGPFQTEPQRPEAQFANARLRPIIELALKENALPVEATMALIESLKGPSRSEVEQRAKDAPDAKEKADDF